ncbi:MAG: hypothetical protein ABF829_07375, partial [Acetobacter fabarum]
MSTTLRVGVIGAGHFGRYHALKIRDVPGESLSGLFDPDPGRPAARGGRGARGGGGAGGGVRRPRAAGGGGG